MKILHILSTNKFSGAENVAITIINQMKNENDIIYVSPDGPIREYLEENNIKFEPIKKVNYFKLRKVIKKYNPDIIHAHDNKATVFASFFKNKSKIISHIHGNNKIMNNRNLKSKLFSICSKKIDKFIWVSESSFNGYYYKNEIKDKSIILYNIIDPNNILEKSHMYDCENYYDLIFLGRLEYPKNPERFIDIINLVLKKDKKIKVAIVGDGNKKKIIQNKVKNYNLSENVQMYGFKLNPFPILENSKILIMTSIYEGTPMAAIEAQALGKPVISTPVDGLKKIIINDQNGFLSDDNEILANKIIEYLDEKKYEILSKNSKKSFYEINDIDKYIRNIKLIYTDSNII